MMLLMYSITIRGKIDFWMSVAFIALYVFYVTVVLVQDRSFKTERSSEVLRKAALAAQITELNRIERSYVGESKKFGINSDDDEIDFEA
jgi:Ca2+/Na+ antiporter